MARDILLRAKAILELAKLVDFYGPEGGEEQLMLLAVSKINELHTRLATARRDKAEEVKAYFEVERLLDEAGVPRTVYGKPDEDPLNMTWPGQPLDERPVSCVPLDTPKRVAWVIRRWLDSREAPKGETK